MPKPPDLGTAKDVSAEGECLPANAVHAPKFDSLSGEIGDTLHVEDYLIKPVAVDPFLEVIKRLKRFWHSDLVLPVLD